MLLALESGTMGEDLEFRRAPWAAGAEGTAYRDVTNSGGPRKFLAQGNHKTGWAT